LHPWWVLFGILLVAFVVFVVVANRLNWQWTGFYRKQAVGLVEIFDYADNVGDCAYSLGKPAPESTPATGMAQVADNLDCFFCNIAGSLCYIGNWRILLGLGLDWF